jgi:putative two-component system response regulator
MDGKGYPEGLEGNRLDILSRILIVGEVFDALVTKRAYKPAWPIKKVMEFLKENAGSHFAPEVVNAMIKVLEKEGELFIDYTPPDLITDIFKEE